MPSRPTLVSHVLFTALMALGVVIFPAVVEAREAEMKAPGCEAAACVSRDETARSARGTADAKATVPAVSLEFRAQRPAATTDGSSWCAQEHESVGDEVCYIDGRKSKDARRTLVVWLHGVIAKNTTWSWNHQRMLARVAKYSNIEIVFPKGESSGSLYAWPGTAAAQAKSEQAMIDQWMSAKKKLEKRESRAFDEVFVFGFSSGAYFTSSLAMRGRVDVDGYATFAGGQSMPAVATPVEHFAPVFVGVCANDSTTAAHSRAFAGALATAGIPRMVSEQKVGHDLSEVHFIQALSFLRSKAKPRVA